MLPAEKEAQERKHRETEKALVETQEALLEAESAVHRAEMRVEELIHTANEQEKAVAAKHAELLIGEFLWPIIEQSQSGSDACLVQ